MSVRTGISWQAMHPQIFVKTLFLLLSVAASCEASSNAGRNSNAASAIANVSPDTKAAVQTEPSNLKAKEDLEAWFGTEGLEDWTYLPMIYTEKIEPDIDCDRCNQHVIEGNVNFASFMYS